ncbi:MAG TPA: hypothetical protein DCE41_27030, partial [Cytophagales bacterium]|nr:hypothetical protein [Cytophagales bacterium]
MMRVFFTLLLLGLAPDLWGQNAPLALDAHGQEPIKMYKTSWSTDVSVIAGASAFTAAIVLWDASFPLPTETEVSRLDPMDVNRFERGAIYNQSSTINTISDVGQYLGGMSSWFLYLDPAVRADGWEVAVMYLEVALLNQAITETAKTIFRRPRPYMYNPDYPLEGKIGSSTGYHSFWSGHTSFSTCMSFYTAKVFNDYHPDSPWRYVVWGAAATVP